MSIEKDKSQGESEEYGDTLDKNHGSEQHSYHDEEGGPTCFMERNQNEDGRPNAVEGRNSNEGNGEKEGK